MLSNEQWLTSGYGADPDAVVSLAAYVGREWTYGASIVRVSGFVSRGAIAECKHSDGSRWFVACDRYASDFASGDDAQSCIDKLVVAMDERATRDNARLVSTYGRGVESDAE